MICTTGAVYPDSPVPWTLVRTPDAVHRGHRSGGAGLCGAHGAGGKERQGWGLQNNKWGGVL